MNNLEIMKLVESKVGKIPLLVKPQLLEIYETYKQDINGLNLEHSPVFLIDMMFVRMHESGVRDTTHPLLSMALSSGKKLSKVTTDFLAKNSINSPFSAVYYDYEELDRMFNSEQETSIEIIIKEGGKEGKAKIKNKPKGSQECKK
jgi:hypothetical protein